MEYAELHCHSNFTFLDAVAHPEELAEAGAERGYSALALTDRNGFYGIVRFLTAARKVGLHGIVGAELTMEGGGSIVVLVENAEGYRTLSRLITRGSLAAAKGQGAVALANLTASTAGLIVLSGGLEGCVTSLLCGEREARAVAGALYEAFGRDRFFLELQDHLMPQEREVREWLRALGRSLGARFVVTGDVRYLERADRQVHDVLRAIGQRTTLAAAGPRLLPNDEFDLKPRAEIARRFGAYPEALQASVEIAERCQFELADIDYRLPGFALPVAKTPQELLQDLAQEGARRRYGRRLSERHRQLLGHELSVIEKLQLAGYFLIVWDIARFCQERGILAQGRGSAANSVVCYALGITAVDPVGLDLLFERFLSEARNEPPDIDIDIEHERREEVIQYVYERYGRDHAALVCEVISYRQRLAVREVGKVFGVPLSEVDRTAKTVDGWGRDREQDLAAILASELAPGARPPQEVFSRWMAMAERIIGFPRHLSIHVGGMVVSARPLGEVVPVENAAMPKRSVIQWDKDDAAEVGLVKIDLLGLGILTMIRKTIDLIAARYGHRIAPEELDYDDPEVYRMMCAADTVGVFQIESRAQRNTLPRLRPRTFYDLVVEVALIRPGPIQGNMVHPYLRRRAGKEPVTVPHPSLAPILHRTLGVPLFQEQGMKVAIVAAGFTPAQADELRRSMGHKRSHARMAALHGALLGGMAARGIPASAAAEIANQLESFADYGFPESHAASFALLVYVSAYLKRYYPAEFAAGLLSSQPMGFYAPASIVADAARHGIETLPLDVNASAWDWQVVGPCPGRLRAGLRCVVGMGPAHRERIEGERQRGAYRSLADFAARTELPRALLRRLALLGAFSCFGGKRRAALWAVEALRDQPALPLSPLADDGVALPAMTPTEEWIEDFTYGRHSARHWPTSFFRHELAARGVITVAQAVEVQHGTACRVAGVLLLRQRPPTAKGFTFLTLEDETGMLDVIVNPQIYEKHRPTLRHAFLLVAAGAIEYQDGAICMIGADFAEWTAGSLGTAESIGRAQRRDFH
ncbi:MAG: error-prone DNA polymerase [Candidatus Schekmanbacteria bacterium]|nr:error-prone DNA polymerase [Candidatus Schekmanbacteria bacterium]